MFQQKKDMQKEMPEIHILKKSIEARENDRAAKSSTYFSECILAGLQWSHSIHSITLGSSNIYLREQRRKTGFRIPFLDCDVCLILQI
jgi:hypothetical protein